MTIYSLDVLLFLFGVAIIVPVMKLGKRDLAGKKQAPEEVSLQACVASKGRSEDSQAKAFPVHCWVQGSTWA